MAYNFAKGKQKMSKADAKKAAKAKGKKGKGKPDPTVDAKGKKLPPWLQKKS